MGPTLILFEGATPLSPSENDLNLQCSLCLENLGRCVNAAEVAAKVDYEFTQTILKLAQNRIHEHRLRLEIWKSDCEVEDGTLSAITPEKEPTLFAALVTILKKINETSGTILRHIQEMEKKAEQASKGADEKYSSINDKTTGKLLTS